MVLVDSADESGAKRRQDLEDVLFAPPILTNTGLLMED